MLYAVQYLWRNKKRKWRILMNKLDDIYSHVDWSLLRHDAA
jgi:hypothetical protein